MNDKAITVFSKLSFQVTYSALLEISLDNNMPAPKSFSLVVEKDLAHRVEATLASLNQQDLETLCTGEYTDQQRIMKRGGAKMVEASNFLEDFFDGKLEAKK